MARLRYIMDMDRAAELLRSERLRTEQLLVDIGEAGQADRTAADQPGDMFDSAQPLTDEGTDDSVKAELQERLAALDRAQGAWAPAPTATRPEWAADLRRTPRGRSGRGVDRRRGSGAPRARRLTPAGPVPRRAASARQRRNSAASASGSYSTRGSTAWPSIQAAGVPCGSCAWNPSSTPTPMLRIGPPPRRRT